MNNLEEILLAKTTSAIPNDTPIQKKDPEREKLESKLREKDEKEYQERDKKHRSFRIQGELTDTIICVAASLADNMQDEAEAISSYTKLLSELKRFQCVAQEADNKTFVNWCTKNIKEVNELIADELNHNDKLFKAYQELTGIEKNKE